MLKCVVNECSLIVVFVAAVAVLFFFFIFILLCGFIHCLCLLPSHIPLPHISCLFIFRPTIFQWFEISFSLSFPSMCESVRCVYNVQCCAGESKTVWNYSLDFVFFLILLVFFWMVVLVLWFYFRYSLHFSVSFI